MKPIQTSIKNVFLCINYNFQLEIIFKFGFFLIYVPETCSNHACNLNEIELTTAIHIFP